MSRLFLFVVGRRRGFVKSGGTQRGEGSRAGGSGAVTGSATGSRRSATKTTSSSATWALRAARFEIPTLR